MKALLIAADVAVWPVVQLSLARIATRIDQCHFTRSRWPFGLYRSEAAIYRRWLRIVQWKRCLPDGAGWVGGRFSKRSLKSRDESYLIRFIAETRRGEAAHWAMVACIPIVCLWNKGWLGVLMSVFGLAANLPCIVVQRYNRAKLIRILEHVERRGNRRLETRV